MTEGARVSETRNAEEELAEVVKALDEYAAPVSSGGFMLSPAGRLRALRSHLVIEANKVRDKARKGERV